jgi:multidrug efflux pump
MEWSEVFVRRPVMATAINIVLLIMGLVSYHHLELRHKPNVAQNEISISTIYPGANGAAVEHQVTKPLEDALSGIDGVKKISSSSQDSHSNIFVKFKTGIDNNRALSQIRDRVFSTLSSLPEAVKRPEIREQGEEKSEIAYLKFEDKTRSIPALSDYIRRVVEDRLRLIEGVATVSSFGNKLYLIAVKPDPALLVEKGVTVKEVVEALKHEKTFASAGEIEGATSKESVIINAMVEKPEDFANITLKITPEGRVTLGSVAEISVSEKPTYLKIRENGQEMVGLAIIAKPQANPLEVASRVHAFVKNLNKTIPPSMHAEVSFDATRPFLASFIEMRHTLWEAITLVGIIVTLSLASVRAALLPMVTVPLCLIGSFALMWVLGFSLNPVTLLALVLAVGLVVDDAIVVIENIYRHMENGLSAFKAALVSMKEISFAVVVMTITLVAVYLPLVFQVDQSAVLFREFAWTLAGSVLISGFVALTLTPALGGKFLKHSKKVVFWERLAERYRDWLVIALQHPAKICLLLVVIAGLGIVGFQRLPSELIPNEDEGYMAGNINADNAVSEAVRQSWFKKVESVLSTVPEGERVLTGIWQDQWMWWNLILKPSEERARTSFDIAKDLRPRLKEIVGPDVQLFDSLNATGDDSFKIIIQYAGASQRLIDAVNNIMTEARKLPGFDAIFSQQTMEKPRLSVKIDRALAAELGVSISAIEETLYTFLSGTKAADFNFDGLDYDVQVRAPLEYRSELNSLNAYFVTGTVGQWVPLGSLVTLKEILEPNEIKHYERMRSASIHMTLQPQISLDKAMAALEPIIKKYLPLDARYHFGGKAEQYRESRNAMWITFGLALAFIYLVLAALFESFIHPFVVLLTVPLSITGAVWAVNFIGGTNNAYTVIGLVTLMGLITKHGILIVDFANRLRVQNHALMEAVLMAATSRLRPVLMTTFAMICGAIPLIFSVGSGAIARKDIGWVIIGGMLMGTVFSLFVVPVAYSLMARKEIQQI